MGDAKEFESSFPDDLVCRKMDGKRWEVLAPFRFRSRQFGETIEVPAGFCTDLASVPWFARWLVSRDGQHTKAAVVHDWLYSDRSRESFSPWLDNDLARRRADRVFKNALLVLGVSKVMVKVLYLSVRVGGRSSFRRIR